jgi:predicted MFS family arabinose efflux permease
MRPIRAESKTYRVARRAAVLSVAFSRNAAGGEGKESDPPPNLTSAFNIAAFNLGSAGGAYLEGLVLDS